MDFQAFVVELPGAVYSVPDGHAVELEEELLQLVDGHGHRHLGAVQNDESLESFRRGLVLGTGTFLEVPSHQRRGFPVGSLPVELDGVVDDAIVLFWAP